MTYHIRPKNRVRLETKFEIPAGNENIARGNRGLAFLVPFLVKQGFTKEEIKFNPNGNGDKTHITVASSRYAQTLDLEVTARVDQDTIWRIYDAGRKTRILSKDIPLGKGGMIEYVISGLSCELRYNGPISQKKIFDHTYEKLQRRFA